MGRRLVAIAALAACVWGGCRARNPDIGRECSTAVPCPDDMLCIADHDGIDVCMEMCPPGPGTTCGNGSLCLDVTAADRVCWIGGPVGTGGVCTSILDCRRGGICVFVGDDPESICLPACTLDRENDCAEGERCHATTDGVFGVCVGPI